MSSGPDTLILLFSILQLISASGFLIILLTVILAPGVSRSPPSVSFCIGWAIACLSYDLLFFSGELNSNDTPNRTLCTVQGALVLSVPVLQATTNLSLIINTWVVVRRALRPTSDKPRSLLSSVSLLVFPYIFSLSVFVGYLLFAIFNPSTAKKLPTSAYCIIAFHRIPAGISTGLFGFFTFFAIVFKFLLGRLLFKHWVSISNLRIYVKMIIRIMVITTVNGIIVMLTVFQMASLIKRTVVDLASAIFPILIIVVIGTERDLWDAWLFWRNKRPSSDPGKATDSQDTSISV